jgi:D-alanine-D-alanine ligase
LEEPVRWEKFLSFSDKYLHNSGKTGGSKTAGGQKGGMSNMGRKIPAEISPELAQQIREFSKKIYRAVDCKGVIRIDYILDSERTNVYVNEVNTIPGSWAFYLWEAVGIKFSEVIDISIREAIKDHDDRKHNIYKYDSDILKNVGGGSKR